MGYIVLQPMHKFPTLPQGHVGNLAGLKLRRSFLKVMRGSWPRCEPGLHALGGVPANKFHLIMVIHGPAAQFVLNNEEVDYIIVVKLPQL